MDQCPPVGGRMASLAATTTAHPGHIEMRPENFRSLMMSEYDEAVFHHQTLQPELGRRERGVAALREEADHLLLGLESDRRKRKEIVGVLQHEVQVLQREYRELHESFERLRVEQHSAILQHQTHRCKSQALEERLRKLERTFEWRKDESEKVLLGQTGWAFLAKVCANFLQITNEWEIPRDLDELKELLRENHHQAGLSAVEELDVAMHRKLNQTLKLLRHLHKGSAHAHVNHPVDASPTRERLLEIADSIRPPLPADSKACVQKLVEFTYSERRFAELVKSKIAADPAAE